MKKPGNRVTENEELRMKNSIGQNGLIHFAFLIHRYPVVILPDETKQAGAFCGSGLSSVAFATKFRGQIVPPYWAAGPRISSIRRSWLYLQIRSVRLADPVLIWPVPNATAKSAMKVFSVSPERWLITAV